MKFSVEDLRLNQKNVFEISLAYVYIKILSLRNTWSLTMDGR